MYIYNINKLTNKKLLLPLKCRPNTNLFPHCVKSIGHFAYAINVVSSNPWAGPSPRIKISLVLLSICTDELISTPKIMTFFPMLPSVNENSKRESNPMS